MCAYLQIYWYQKCLVSHISIDISPKNRVLIGLLSRYQYICDRPIKANNISQPIYWPNANWLRVWHRLYTHFPFEFIFQITLKCFIKRICKAASRYLQSYSLTDLSIGRYYRLRLVYCRLSTSLYLLPDVQRYEKLIFRDYIAEKCDWRWFMMIRLPLKFAVSVHWCHFIQWNALFNCKICRLC